MNPMKLLVIAFACVFGEVLEPCNELEIQHSHTQCSTEAYSSCVIECDDGYTTEGNNFVQCMLGGTWSDQHIVCTQIPCEVPEIDNSNSAECGIIQVGDTCDGIKCNNGYMLSFNLETVTCDLGAVLSTHPECVLVPCYPLYIEHSINSHSCNTGVHEFCNIECEEGYRLLGPNTVACEFSGSWSQLPSCELIFCPNPAIDNANAEECQGTLASEECDFAWECNQKYKKVKVNVFQHDGLCNANGEWEDLAFCEEIFCPLLDLENSDATQSCHETAADSTCAFACDENYEIRDGGNAEATCNIAGMWVNVAECLEIIRCPPPVVLNSEAGVECASVRAGELCKFTCEQNFGIVNDPTLEDGDTTIQCTDVGEWVYLPNCTEAIVHGRIIEDPIQDGDMKSFEQLNSLLDDILRTTISDVMGLEGAETEDIILFKHLAGGGNFYAFEAGSDDHTNLFNRQPHAFDKTVDDFYMYLLYNGMQRKILSDEEQQKFEETVAALDQLNYDEDERMCTICNDPFKRLLYQARSVEDDPCNYNCFVPEGWRQDFSYTIPKQYFEYLLEDLAYGPVTEMRDRFEISMGNNFRGDWISTPSAEDLTILFEGNSTTTDTYEYKITRTQVDEHSVVEEFARPGFAAYKNGQFLTVNNKRSEINLEIKMEFKKVATVYISPGQWYDDSWQALVLNPRYVSEDYTINPTGGEGDKIPIWGNEGLMNSIIKRILVAQEMSIEATADSSFFAELATIYEGADSVRFGNICSGKACSEAVNVVIDTTAPDLATTPEDMTNYLFPIVSGVLKAVFREGTANSIAILGSHLSLHGADYSSIIFQLAESLDILEENYLWFDGIDSITTFFENLQTGDVNPKLIWFAADQGFGNGIDAEESQVLIDFAHIINNYTTSGGGLIAHGDPQLVFGWLQTLLPGIRFEYECDASSPEVTHAGRLLLPPTFSNEVVRRIPCLANFKDQFGNFDQLVSDINGNFIVLGAYGGITEGSSPYSNTEDSQKVLQSFIEETSGNLMYNLKFESRKGETPKNYIVATYAPRFPHGDIYQGDTEGAQGDTAQGK